MNKRFRVVVVEVVLVDDVDVDLSNIQIDIEYQNIENESYVVLVVDVVEVVEAVELKLR
jgi:hypothetical protein